MVIFLDNITISFENGIDKVYNVVEIDDKLYLRTEDEPLIKSLLIEDSKLDTNYEKSGTLRSVCDIESIEIEKGNFLYGRLKKKWPNFIIEGSLLIYDEEMAIKYYLNKELAHDIVKEKNIKREKIKEEQ